jgi:hypothetical protein
MIKRREFIGGLAGVAAWPMVIHAQQPDRVRRIGVLMASDENDPEGKAYFSGFTQGLAELGWIDGSNLRMNVRWAGDNLERLRIFAKELIDLQPAVILAYATPATAALQRETRTIPIVFVGVSDPVGAGFVASHATAPPSPAMNSRRRISDLPMLDRQPIALGAACLALRRRSSDLFCGAGGGFWPIAAQSVWHGMSATGES